MLLRDHPFVYYLLLFFHVGTNDTARGNLGSIKSDYRDLCVIVKYVGPQIVFPSVLLVRGKGIRRKALIPHIDNCIWNNRLAIGFWFYGHGSLFEHLCAFGRDGIHLAKQGKGIFASKMADVVRKAFS